MSCLSKIFTGVLNKRINKWCDENNVIYLIVSLGLEKGVPPRMQINYMEGSGRCHNKIT